MVESPFSGMPPTASARPDLPVESGMVARILADAGTPDFVRTWLGAALGRDPLLAYREAATLAGILELLSCEEAQAWLRPALVAALGRDPEQAFQEVVEVAAALKPAAMVLEALEQGLPEPANSQDLPPHGAPRGWQRFED